ncbi:MAG: hypothetical protein QW478_08885 [Candidatus Micrarchaeaceae archaeon]
MASELRYIGIALMVTPVILTLLFNFVFAYSANNNVPLPSGIEAQYSQNIQPASSILLNQLNTSQSGLSSNLQAPSSSLGLVGDFMVFGGLIVSALGYIAAIPNALSLILGTVSNNPFLGSIALTLSGLIGAIVVYELVIEIYSSVQKYRL